MTRAPRSADRRVRDAALRPEVRTARREVKGTQVASTRDPLAGLTPEEQRVHGLLLNALERENSRTGVGVGLTYAEKKRVAETLDLDFIQTELDRMEAVRQGYEGPPPLREIWDDWKSKALVAFFILLLPGAVWRVLTEQSVGSLLPAVAIGAALYVLVRSFGHRARSARPSTRQKIYADLRELAVALDLSDDADSPSIRRADALIDSFSAVDDAPVPGTRLANR